MSDSSHAVFLSYASQDTEAARHIAEALRAFGVEVWFDQEELRGGDAWDHKIRRQIHECALFIPVISATTQERGEGYFRREWHQAVERMHDMAEGVPFIVPVVIDDTRDVDAIVPEGFLRVQWTRLPRGAPTGQFVEHVKRLLETPGRPAGGGSRPEDSRRATEDGRRIARRRPDARVWVLGAAVLLVAAIAVVLVTRKAEPPAAPAPSSAKQPEASASVDLAAAKSIAVLPFTNLSPEPENAYFTDGMHEDILTNLAGIRELRVISRTSVMQYRGTTKTVRQIGEELGVAYVLDGTVRRAGTNLRVTAKLINARTDEHAWAKAYNRELTDVFAIQSELATEIAGALRAELNPDERAVLAGAPTRSVRAYELTLQARDLVRRGAIDAQARRRAQQLVEAALAEDPQFFQAWIVLVEALSPYGFQGGPGWDPAPASSALAEARRLAPGDPWVSFAEANLHYAARDFLKALECTTKARAARPMEPEFLRLQARIERRMGRLDDAVPRFDEALRLDPLNVALWRELSESHHLQRHFLGAAGATQQLDTLEPGSGWALSRIGFQFLATANSNLVGEYEHEWRSLRDGSRAFLGFDSSLPGLQLWQWTRDTPALIREATAAAIDIAPIEDLTFYRSSSVGIAVSRRWCIMLALLAENETGLARNLAEAHVRTYGALVLAPESDRVGAGEWLAMGATWYHLTGQKTEAVGLLERLRSLDARETDAFWRAYRMPWLLPIWGQIEPDEAAAAFLRELARPMSFVSLDESAASHWLYRPFLTHPRIKPLIVAHEKGKWLPYLADRVPEYAEFEKTTN
jgi:TolB-like protein